MLTLQVEDVLLLVLAWLVCGLVSAVIFMRFVTMRYAGQAVIASLKDPTEDVRQAVGALMTMILETQVKTGRKLQGEDGKEIEEQISMIQYMAGEVWRIIQLKIRAKKGGEVSQLAQSPEGQLLMGFGGPRKGQTTGEYMIEQLGQRLMPQIEQMVSKAVNNKQGDTSL